MSIFKRLFEPKVTQQKQDEAKTPPIDREYDFDPWNEMRIEVLDIACKGIELELTTHERGQFLEVVFSHPFFDYYINLEVAKTPKKEMREKLKTFVLNRVLPQHQLN